jgi:hypothetical protein
MVDLPFLEPPVGNPFGLPVRMLVLTVVHHVRLGDVNPRTALCKALVPVVSYRAFLESRVAALPTRRDVNRGIFGVPAVLAATQEEPRFRLAGWAVFALAAWLQVDRLAEFHTIRG